MYEFEYVIGDSLHRFPISEDSIRIGRDPRSDIVIPDPTNTVSRNHLRVEVLGTRIVITDLGSTKGTHINGQQISPNQPFEVRPPVTFFLGGVECRIVVATINVQSPSPSSKTVKAWPPDTSNYAIDVEPNHQFYDTVGNTRGIYNSYLPDVYCEGQFIDGFLRLFESIWEPMEWTVDQLNRYFDPRTCPPEMLSWLGDWVSSPRMRHMSTSLRRLVVSRIVELHQLGGTAYGVTEILALLTGCSVEIEPLTGRAYTVKVTVSSVNTNQNPLKKSEISSLVETYIPAHVAYELVVMG